MRITFLCSAAIAASGFTAVAAPPSHIYTHRFENPLSGPILESNIERSLRYQPDGTDFLIENGPESFNRSLYSSGSGFRVEAGDKPEAAFYLAKNRRGGNLRVGFKVGDQIKWSIDAEKIVSRYRPGSMVYEVSDPALGGAKLHLTLIPSKTSDVAILKAELEGTADNVELVIAVGAGDGRRGRRDGDLGTEAMSLGDFFKFRPGAARGSTVEVKDGEAVLKKEKVGSLAVATSPAFAMQVGNAADWDSPAKLLSAHLPDAEAPIAVGKTPLKPGTPVFVEVRSPHDTPSPSADFAANFETAEKQRQQAANVLQVETPDPFINAAAAAIGPAADGVWDNKAGAWQHGAVAWRVLLLGWRGDYIGTALGLHDRSVRFFDRWIKNQNTKPIPEKFPPADEDGNLTRWENAINSNGDMAGSHYDMNLVFIDALFRHILWTGDLDYARKVWPAIERHLAWEQRMFRRVFDSDNLPLYEGYCCVWASDDLWYSGGGVTHSSSYNFYHNTLAARVAKAIGKDPAPYEQEAKLIGEAMRKHLWLPQEGWFAEAKDWLGHRRTRKSPALWTFYHTLDSNVPTATEAWQMSRRVDAGTHIPVCGPGIPDEGLFVLPTTDWMPYAWSTNNVAVAENAHTALAYWQANRADKAFRLFKGILIDTMFSGECPGNIGMVTKYDMARGESQRDFADSIGVVGRAFVEGLFGVRPDSLAGELVVHPGFPDSWDSAKFNHPDLSYEFSRQERSDSYTFEARFPKALTLRLQIPARGDRLESVTVNGQPATWKFLEDSIGVPRVEITATSQARNEIVVKWSGEAPAVTKAHPATYPHREVTQSVAPATATRILDPQNTFSASSGTGSSSVTGTASGIHGARTSFVEVKQGDANWWLPIEFDIARETEIVTSEKQDDTRLAYTVTDHGKSTEATVTEGLLPGTNRIVHQLADGKSVTGLATNWKLKAPADTQWQPLDLTDKFNDRITQIFKNEYLSPRAPFPSLSVAKNGYGTWCHPQDGFDVDDTGLRALADKNDGTVTLPQGIPLRTPGSGDTKNVAFVSLWDNHPDEITVPLEGKASHLYLFLAGSTNSMNSRVDNGEIIVTYTDGSTERLPLHNPINWWPIDQDYEIDDFAFKRPDPVPPRVDLKTGKIRVLETKDLKRRGKIIEGGAGTVLDLPLSPDKTLQSFTVRALSNEIIIGLMSATLAK
ncbi:MAG: DUF4450 domain-containing protein [Luteolibacter sp.]